MPKQPDSLAVDLKSGVVPISKTSASIAALLRRSRAQHKPIIITQQGYPTAVLLDIELYTDLRDRAKRAAASKAAQVEPAPVAVELAPVAEPIVPVEAPAQPVEAPAQPVNRSRGGRRKVEPVAPVAEPAELVEAPAAPTKRSRGGQRKAEG